MTGAPDSTLPGRYFDDVYAASDDPWRFETSTYEAAKYADTMSALGERHFDHAFEIGCSIGVLTRLLAGRCTHLLAVDVSEVALRRARERCADLPQVELRRLDVVGEFPDDRFDLVVLSEVGYYWSRYDLGRMLERIASALTPGGQLLLVHWTPPVHDYPLRGDDVHAAALALTGEGGVFDAVSGWRRENYRLDLLSRRPGAGDAPAAIASR